MVVFEPKGKKVTVMGLGLHGGGIGAAKWLLNHGAKVTVTDLKDEKTLGKSLSEVEVVGPIDKILGRHREEDFTKADIVIKNPGVPNESKFLALARAAGVPIMTDIGIFFENFPGAIVGVTGTKGKTTTTTLLHEILRAAGKKLLLGGNLRRSPLDDMDAADTDTLAVLELSSFQLEILAELKKSPLVAIWTNIYPDHLDRYKDMAAYTEAKAQIFLHQKPDEFMIFNSDQPELVELAKRAQSKVIFFSTEQALPEGIFVRDGGIIWKMAGQEQMIGEVSAIKLAGSHNIANVLAAVVGALVLGAPVEVVKEVIETFKGVANRLELVRELDGVKYINDTASTIPTSAIAALHAFHEPVVLIAGGHDKKLPLEKFAHTILQKVHRMILFDSAVGQKLYEHMQKDDAKKLKDIVITPFARSMAEAVERARIIAKPGSIVLLSPGAASFGMFQNEFDRGDQFVAVVKALS